MKILIIKNKRIGDVLVASIVANNLKKIYPDSHITFLCYDYAAPVLLHNPNIDRVWQINDQELKQGLNLFKLAKELRAEKFDLIIDLYTKLQSQIISALSSSKKRIGFDKRVIPFAYTHKIPILKSRISDNGKAIDDRLNVLRFLNSNVPLDPHPKLYISHNEQTTIESLLKDKGFVVDKPSVMIGVLGSDPTKSLPLAYVAELIDYISTHYDVQILLNYIPAQRPLVDKLLALVKDKSQVLPEIMGKNIREYILIMNNVNVLIANEGGAVHIAKALDKPTFTLYSPYVNKEHWATFENDHKNESLHLKELKPELFSDISSKEIKKQTSELYNHFKPEKIIPRLASFLDKNLTS